MLFQHSVVSNEVLSELTKQCSWNMLHPRLVSEWKVEISGQLNYANGGKKLNSDYSHLLIYSSESVCKLWRPLMRVYKLSTSKIMQLGFRWIFSIYSSALLAFGRLCHAVNPPLFYYIAHLYSLWYKGCPIDNEYSINAQKMLNGNQVQY